jgi:hypothetical protein
MMDATEPPGAPDLLATALKVLREDITPALAGDARYKSLMVANAIAIALRAITTPARSDLDQAQLATAIRAGALDASTHAQLLALTEARCAVSAPKAV